MNGGIAILHWGKWQEQFPVYACYFSFLIIFSRRLMTFVHVEPEDVGSDDQILQLSSCCVGMVNLNVFLSISHLWFHTPHFPSASFRNSKKWGMVEISVVLVNWEKEVKEKECFWLGGQDQLIPYTVRPLCLRPKEIHVANDIVWFISSVHSCLPSPGHYFPILS